MTDPNGPSPVGGSPKPISGSTPVPQSSAAGDAGQSSTPTPANRGLIVSLAVPADSGDQTRMDLYIRADDPKHNYLVSAEHHAGKKEAHLKVIAPWLKNLGPDPYLVEAGPGPGNSALTFLKAVPGLSILAVEQDPAYYQVLIKNPDLQEYFSPSDGSPVRLAAVRKNFTDLDFQPTPGRKFSIGAFGAWSDFHTTSKARIKFFNELREKYRNDLEYLILEEELKPERHRISSSRRKTPYPGNGAWLTDHEKNIIEHHMRVVVDAIINFKTKGVQNAKTVAINELKALVSGLYGLDDNKWDRTSLAHDLTEGGFKFGNRLMLGVNDNSDVEEADIVRVWPNSEKDIAFNTCYENLRKSKFFAPVIASLTNIKKPREIDTDPEFESIVGRIFGVIDKFAKECSDLTREQIGGKFSQLSGLRILTATDFDEEKQTGKDLFGGVYAIRAKNPNAS